MESFEPPVLDTPVLDIPILDAAKKAAVVELQDILDKINGREPGLSLPLEMCIEYQYARSVEPHTPPGCIRYDWISGPVDGRGLVLFTTQDPMSEASFGELNDKLRLVNILNASQLPSRVTHKEVRGIHELNGDYRRLRELVEAARSFTF